MITPARLDDLMNPRSIAVIGASESPGSVGGQVVAALLSHGYVGKIHPINPRCNEVHGLPAHATLTAIAAPPPEVAIIAIPSIGVAEALLECAQVGIRFAVILGGGFAETGSAGALLQRDIAAMAAANGLRLVGPNCQGIMNVRERVFAGFGALFSLDDLTEGPMSIVTQSGAFGSAVVNVASELGLGLRYFVSTGNEADLSVLDFIEFCLADEATKMVAAYIEGVRDGRRLMDLGLQALRTGKPILVWKAAKSVGGRRATISHTGAMATGYALYQAAFRQVGIIEIREIQDIIDMSKILLASKLPEGPRVGVVSVSGGAGILIADEAAELGLELATLDEATIATLSTFVPHFGSLQNPVDLTGQIFTSPELAARAVEAVANDANVDFVVVVNGSMQGALAKEMADDLVTAAACIPKPMYVVWSARTDRALEAYSTVDRHGIPRFTDPVRCTRAVAAAVHFRAKSRSSLLEDSPSFGVEWHRKGPRRADFINSSSTVLPEYQAKDFLEEAGIPTPTRCLVHSPDEAVRAATRIGYPVVVKAQSADAPHKTDIGAVRLGVQNEAQAREAYTEVTTNFHRHLQDGRLAGVLIETMVTDASEVILGGLIDDQFGPVVMLGMGGIMAEVFKEVVFRIAPVNARTAYQMIAEFRGRKVLEGTRGSSKRDIDALASTLVRFSYLTLDWSDLFESIDINPLFVLTKGVSVGDCLIIRRPHGVAGSN